MSMIPILGFVNLSDEQFLTLECYNTSLQPQAQFAWKKRVWLFYNYTHDSRLRLHKPCILILIK